MTRESALADPEGFIAGLQGPAFIDEIQHAPDLLLAIKRAVDRDLTPTRFLLTGSANLLTARKVKDALTGRIETIPLWPLAQSEIHGSAGNFVDALFAAEPPRVAGAAVGREAFIEVVAAGGYPEARVRSGRRRARWFANYLDTTLDRDLREISDRPKAPRGPTLAAIARLAGRERSLLSRGRRHSQGTYAILSWRSLRQRPATPTTPNLTGENLLKSRRIDTASQQLGGPSS